jgi:hypothetical protein
VNDSPIRPLPAVRWYPLWILLFFIAWVAFFYFFQSPVPAILFLIATVAFVQLRGVRRPDCRVRLNVGDIPLENSDLRQQFYECPDCQALWDPDFK